MKIQTLRRTSQIAFLAVTLTGIIVGTTGIVYPYFFCYSCPWDVGNCPLGLMEHGFIDIQITFWVGMSLLLYLFGFLALVGTIFGRGFCGWACPIGTLQDVTRKLKISDKVRSKLRHHVDPRYKYTKYLILLAIPVTAYLSRDLFYTNLCPVGGVTGTLPTLLFYSGEWTLGSSFPVKLTSIILFSILIILVTRGWCKYLCPIGAFLAPWNKISAVGVRRDEASCKNCNLCEMKCPMDVKEIGSKPDIECVLCGRCVDSCKFGSLKMKIVPFNSKKTMAIWIILLFISASMLTGGAWLDGYSRADDINSIPCLGCLALDPFVVGEWRTTDSVQPEFILEPLISRPVFLHYRTDVCPGCDEMEPHIAILESQYGDRVEFIHINLDHATPEEDASYDIYDTVGTPNERFGVPMFATVIVEMNGTKPEIIYNTQYGSSSDQGESKRLELEETIIEALARHSLTTAPIGPVTVSDTLVFSELYVDMGCVNCYKSEDALMELEENRETNFVTFVTDAPGISGDYGTYREAAYVNELNITVLGHPLAVFSGGPGKLIGALSTASALASYRTEINAATLDDTNISLSGHISRSGGTLFSNITLSNLESSGEDIMVEAFLVERLSRWNNLQGEPIPNAFVDLVVNETVSIPADGFTTIPVSWNGTGDVQFSDMRIGNTGILVVLWKDGVQITSRMLESSEPDILYMTSATKLKPALPNNSAEFSFTLYNFMATGMEVGLDVDAPANWVGETSASSMYIPGNGTGIFTITMTGNGTSAADPMYNFTARAWTVLDPTVRASTRVQVDVRDDIVPPTVQTPVSTPAEPDADELITINVEIEDASGIEHVRLSYFSCTPVACSPYYTVEMNLTVDGVYAASVYPVAHDHTDFHYSIIAEDVHGNILETSLQDIELEPVVHHAETVKPKWLGVVLLIVFAAIAILVAISSREKRPEEKTPVPEEENGAQRKF